MGAARRYVKCPFVSCMRGETYRALSVVLFNAEEEEHAFGIERANAAAKRALSGSESGARGGRGGRTVRGGRGGRGGRSGRANQGTRGGRGGNGGNRAENGKDEQVGEKRKRAVEPDGGHDVGVRGQAVPTIVAASASKKPKLDGGESS
jgi:lupus La protein